MITSGTCKIDICGEGNARVAPTSTTKCNQYLKNLLASCKSGNRVGGQIFPQTCNVLYEGKVIDDPELKDWMHYRIQFSHSSHS